MRILFFRCAVLLGLAVVAISEGLSVLHALNRTGILAAWTLVVVGMLVVAVRVRRRRTFVTFFSRRIRAFGYALLDSPMRFLLVVSLGVWGARFAGYFGGPVPVESISDVTARLRAEH